ncbi:uncharacterized protein HMPREF1541_10658 [Cyphellophora europaea CBS 101466]|uniref:Homeobox and C2H2 transcription factor n=1 Tax=Cyphellophora europaea (strain CBS 101466) TaxID=1220924 RepID=W2S7T2_CYPE1|nr:uncharacterized protein HMPREF1541_10658 [Cyphellophora europaea CBS 101466]ETN44108.1 hypothetical protein HMPREF1541_10658 [Cyphellophora europaea CBS 101466]
MEYFDFHDASDAHALPPLDVDELSSLYPEYTQDEANDCFDSLFFDKSHALPADPAPPAQQGPVMLKLINDIEIEAIPQPDDPSLDYPMFRAKNPCDLCARMGLDCFLATRGAMVTGCTCCISLYKECSFTHPKLPRGFVNNLNGIKETEAETSFGRHHAKTLRSFDEARVRKTGARFPRDAVKILKQWLAEHSDHPYPNEREKDELKQLTGLKRSQISNWLANARRRGKVRPAENSGSSSPMLGAIDIPQKSNDLSELNPLDRWKASPPENEPASMTAIARAVTSTPLPHQSSQSASSSLSLQHNSDPHSRGPSRQNSSSGSATNFSMFREPSISSFDTHSASTASDLTRASSRSAQSRNSFSSGERRRRRRAPMTQRAAAQQAKSRSARIFQCTFCTDTFPAKYDWQRHEKSLHLALERWTCCPTGGTYTVPSTGLAHCVFCNCLDPTPSHLETVHNFNVCQEQTQQERTFYRKDHLRQHLKLRHGAKFERHMEAWKTTTNEIKSACGFCPSKFTTWSQRADHLAAHFRNGADMKDWSNGWGFDAAVERCVENAIPPYLIGHERVTMEPYVARLTKRGPASNPPDSGGIRHSRRQSSATPGSSRGSNSGLTYGTSSNSASVAASDVDEGEPDQMTRDSNCWGRLEQELTKFLTQHKLVGTIPSDKQLQDQARIIIYEDDDPWNWTCADNALWLDTFKWQHGVGPLTDAMRGAGLGPEKVGCTAGGASEDVMACGAGGGLIGHGREGVRLIEQVDVQAPYVVKGGNRLGGSEAGGAAGTRRKARGRRTNKAVTSQRNARSRTGSSVSSRSSTSHDLPTFAPDTSMDLDFEGVDFGGLDLGLSSAGDDGMGGSNGMPSMSAGPTSLSMGGYAPVNTLPMQMPMPMQVQMQDDFFGGQGFEMPSQQGLAPSPGPNGFDMDMGLGMGVPLDVNASLGRGMAGVGVGAGAGAGVGVGQRGVRNSFDYENHTQSSDGPHGMGRGVEMHLDLDQDLDQDQDQGLDMMDDMMGASLTKTDTVQTSQPVGSPGPVLLGGGGGNAAAAGGGGGLGSGGGGMGKGKRGSQSSDLSFMNEAEIQALEGWTGGLH